MDPRTVFCQGLICGTFVCAAIVSWIVGNEGWAGLFALLAFFTIVAFIGSDPVN
jgi:formate/nitrite transporter FocA (FNT family)